MGAKKIVAFVGMPGSGKGTCTDFLADKFGIPIIHFGNMVYEEVQRRGLDNIKDEVFVREDMRAKEGKAVLAKHVARKAMGYFEDGQRTVALDGLYSWSEYKYLLETFGDDLIVTAIVANKTTRRQRVLNRKDSHRKYTMEQLVARELAEIENLEKGGPIAYADYTILNEFTTEKMTKTVEEILLAEGVKL